MSSISKNQQDYCKLAQLFHSTYIRNQDESISYMLRIENVNLKILNEKSIKGAYAPLTGATLLHIVCRQKNIKALDVLLKRGADFTATNKNGNTALHQVFHEIFFTSAFPAFEVDATAKLENALIQSLLKAHVDSSNPENPRSADGLSHFHIACAANHLEAVQLFLNSGISINEAVNVKLKIFPGYTPLHFAVRCCGYETAKFLLDRGADVNAKDAKGFTPLHRAIVRNLQLVRIEHVFGNKNCKKLSENLEEKEKIIELFLEDDRVPKVDENGFSKFHAVCTLSNSSVVERFLRDSDINCTVNMGSSIWPGYTALHFAASFNNIEIVQLLLKNGADIAAKDDKGTTPFDICVENCSVKDLYDVLLSIPAFTDILFSDNTTKLSDFVVAMQMHSTSEIFFQSKPKDLCLPNNSPLWPGHSLAQLAVLFSKYRYSGYYIQVSTHLARHLDYCLASMYLNCGGTAINQDAQGRTLLHLAFYQEKLALVDQFFKRQLGLADVVDGNGLSHLHIACMRDNADAVRTLLSTGADVNNIYKGETLTWRLQNSLRRDMTSILKLMSGSTPLHIATKNKDFVIVKILLENGADANLIDADGRTPMHRFVHLPKYISRSTNFEAVKEVGNVLFSSCDLKNVICPETGLSRLHVACYTANVDAVDRLLKLGADPNAVFLCKKTRKSFGCEGYCTSGYTPMHFAVKNKDMKIIELLLQGGADILRKRSKNGTTLYYDTILHYKNVIPSSINVDIVKHLTKLLVSDAALRQRVEEDTGLTFLHIACFLPDVGQIKNLLVDSRIDVNAQVHVNSPIWAKATPLHILCERGIRTEADKTALKLLLDCGADVMITNSAGDTPVLCYKLRTFPDNSFLSLPLSYQTDFSVNPVNEEGISHFHLACMLGEHTIVEKFLQNGVDVNLPIDYLSKSMTFRTPLQFMLQSRQSHGIAHADSLLKTMDVLLKYGADVNAEDEAGSTPLLEVARSNSPRELFFQKLLKAGADINYANNYGETALAILIDKHDDLTFEDLQIFCNNPVTFNTFNTKTGKGMISKIIEKASIIHTRKLILEAMMENRNLFAINSTGRTPIHNLVANRVSAISTAEYAKYIDKFMKMGYDIDTQDSEGETALHLGVHFRNKEAIYGLLISGADINITNARGRVAFDSLYHAYIRPPLQIGNNRCLKTVIAMQVCGLEVSSKNLAWANSDQLCEIRVQQHRETVLEELEGTKFVKIGSGTLTLRDFLSETGAVASRPSMASEAEREAVDKFFESVDGKSFPELSYLFKLQYRKMMKRLPLMNEAVDSLRGIMGSVNGFSMPEICCRMIIRFLANTEVKHLIASVSLN